MNSTRISNTLTIAQHSAGIVHQDAQTLVTWTPWRADWLGDGTLVTAVMTICTHDDEPIIIGFDVADADALQAEIDKLMSGWE